MNKIQIIANVVSIGIILIVNNKMKSDFLIDVLPFLTLGLNIVTLIMLVVLFFYRNKVEARTSSLFLESVSRQEMFLKLRKATIINEGKFIFFFIWGANIDCELGSITDSRLDKSGLTEEYTEDLDII